ncbi:pectate lyase D [Phytophthora nicotianae]|uniref:Pectate lyase D n=1 Tax=Phytophthora nicotianae TaxID=4792 RepID=A0A0W8DEK1_PHYNI|nr:pectate lyase D [Phytophthora nicotianae]
MDAFQIRVSTRYTCSRYGRFYQPVCQLNFVLPHHKSSTLVGAQCLLRKKILEFISGFIYCSNFNWAKLLLNLSRFCLKLGTSPLETFTNKIHEEDDDIDVLLLTAVQTRREASLRSVRREVHQQMIESAWRGAMRTRHYLTVSCMDVPCVAVWMALYKNGLDKNFINATSLTRAAFKTLLRRLARFYHLPSGRGRPRSYDITIKI